MSGARGEGTISLPDGREVHILFTNRALAEAEAALNRSVIKLLEDFQDGGAGITEAAMLLRSGMEAARRESKVAGRVTSLNDAFDVMDQVGFAETLTVAMEAVAAVMSYGTEDADPNA